MKILDRPSPNHGDRRGAKPDVVVLHYTAMASAEAALSRLCDPGSEVSAHYLIAEDGTVLRLVDESRRAWHAGAGAWGSCVDVNSRSIGIELANSGDTPFSWPQVAALESLLRGIMRTWRVPPERVIGHACMAPERKRDPGRRFDWRGLARAGLAIWLDVPARCGDGVADAGQAQAALRRFGIPSPSGGEWDAPTLSAASAFRARFRPWEGEVGGPLDAGALDHLERLADRWPCA